MPYIKCYSEKLSANHFRMHLWEDDGYKSVEWHNSVYQECREEEAEYSGINGEPLRKIDKWYFSRNPEYSSKNTHGLHFHDIKPHQKFLVERYGTNDEPSKNHKEVFFDIEIEIGGALTEEYIERAPMPVTSIAWYYKQKDEWVILILDKKNQLKHTKAKNREIIPCRTEQELLLRWLEKLREIDPDILVGYNCIPKTSRIWGKKEIIEIKDILTNDELFGVENRVLRYVSSNMKEQIEIKLDNGNTLYSSKDHIFPVYEKTTKYQSLNPLLESQSDKTVAEMMEVNNPLYLEISKGNNPNKNQNMSLVGGDDKTLIDNNDLYLLGLIFTDGWYHNEKDDKNSISISNSDKMLVENIIPLINRNRKPRFQIKNINQLKPHQSKEYPNSKPNYRIRAFSKKNNNNRFDLLKKFIYKGDKKEININLLSKLSKEQFKYFFSGCIDGDGGVNNQRIHFCNYENNIHKIHELLLWNGVFSTIESNETALNIPYCNIFDNKEFIDSLILKGYKNQQRNKELKYFEFNNKPSNNAKKYVLTDKVLIRIKEINNTKKMVDMCDITTTTHYFTYEGIKTHNCDYFDIPYLFYRIDNTLGPQYSSMLSPLGKVECKRDSKWWFNSDQTVKIIGVESLDYMRLHRKYSWKDEPSWKLDAIGEKYVGVNKIEYEGTLDDLFEADIYKFIEYNFMDVNILKLLDEKLQYIGLTKNLSHKGKHNYSEVYHNSITQDGAISAYLLSQGIIPPPKDPNPRTKKNYAGGFLFCPKAGLYKYMFDEDLTSLYPSIIMSLNIGKETFVGRIIDADDRNNRLGLNDLKEKDPTERLLIENARGKQTYVEAQKLIEIIESQSLTISANGSMFRTDKESVLSTILNKWFQERKLYKGKMKEAYKAGDSEKGEYYHLYQYTVKILLNSLYGALALPNFRYSLNPAILSEAITLSGHRIIQESALCANRHMNKVMKNKDTMKKFKDEIEKINLKK